jgi:hypothetical protein
VEALPAHEPEHLLPEQQLQTFEVQLARGVACQVFALLLAGLALLAGRVACLAEVVVLVDVELDVALGLRLFRSIRQTGAQGVMRERWGGHWDVKIWPMKLRVALITCSPQPDARSHRTAVHFPDTIVVRDTRSMSPLGGTGGGGARP